MTGTSGAVVVGVDGAGRTHRIGQLVADSGRPVLRVDDLGVSLDELTAQLDQAAGDARLIVADDAHLLPVDVVRVVTRAARRGAGVLLARRPTLSSPELAELDSVVAATGTVQRLRPLDERGVGDVIAAVTGTRPAREQIARVYAESAGLPAVVAAIAGAPGDTPPALVARVQQRLALVDTRTAALATLLALRLDLADDVLASAAGLAKHEFAQAMRVLSDAGLLMPDGERMIPAVAAAVLAEELPAGRRRLHEQVAQALLAGGADHVSTAEQLRAAGIRTPHAARSYAAVADRLRFTDPGAAAAWYDLAVESGADLAAVAAGRAEAATLLGLPVDLDAPTASPGDAARMALTTGVVTAHQGRARRAAEVLTNAGPLGRLLAVPSLVTTGQGAEARSAAQPPAEHVPVSVLRLADAARELPDPVAALPLLLEAADLIEQAPLAGLLPDTPHALGALAAVTAGDTSTAEHLLVRAQACEVGGPVGALRHGLLRAWVRMRAGRVDSARSELSAQRGALLPGRERLLLATLSAGLARRTGDIGMLRAAWGTAEPVLARRVVDLMQIELLEELLVAATRLGEQQRVAPIIADLDAILAQLGRPPLWSAALGWVRLHIAVAEEDADAANAAAAELVESGVTTRRGLAQRAAARHWARALAGDVAVDAVHAAAEELAAVRLPWEASRLAGHAAIRTADPAGARRLLETARDLGAVEPTAAERSRGVLSDRETEVARLVLAGRTHKEIGAQLYLSPRTVEHHVARIRTKLGATSRAELTSALRGLIGD